MPKKRIHVREMRIQPAEELGSGGPEAKEPECSVSGPLALTFRMSRWCGLAPVRVVTRRDQLRVSWSWPMAVYSYLLVLTLDVIFLFKLRNMAFKEVKWLNCDIKKVACMGVVIYEALVLVIINMAVCRGRRNMGSVITYLNQINAIISTVNRGCPLQMTEKKRSLFVVVYLSVSWIQSLLAFSFQIKARLNVNEFDMKVMLLSGAYYFSAFIVAVFDMQYVLMALLIDTALSSINDAFKNLINNIDLKSNSASFDAKAEGVSLHRVTEWYSATCALAPQVPGSQGVVLPTLVISFTMLLVTSSYYGLVYYLTQDMSSTYGLLTISGISYHVLSLMILVEPGHRLQKEMTRTRSLLSQLLTRPWARLPPLADEADQLFRQLTGSQPRCCPMGVCEFARPLVCSVLGGMVTYLVIIVQYQQINST